jgi:hypothetical protein
MVDPANVEKLIEDACNNVLTFIKLEVMVDPIMLDNSIEDACRRYLMATESVVIVHPANVETPIEDADKVLVDIVDPNIDRLVNTFTFMLDADIEER